MDNDLEKTKAFLRQYEGDTLLAYENALRYVEELALKMRNNLCSIFNSGLIDQVREKDMVYRDKYSYERKLMEISVTEQGSSILLTVPALLPHRKSKPRTLFEAPLLEAIEEFLREGKGRAFFAEQKSGVLVIISHSYQTRWMVRDNDNIEIKTLLDALVTSGLIPSDQGDELSVLTTASLRDTNLCRVILIPKSKAALSLDGVSFQL